MKNIVARPAPPRMRTIREVAALTGVPEHRVRLLCKQGTIAAVPCGRRFLVNYDRFLEFLNDPNGFALGKAAAHQQTEKI